MSRYFTIVVLLFVAFAVAQPETVNAQKPSSGFAPEKQKKRKRNRAFIPDSPEQVQKKQDDDADKLSGKDEVSGEDGGSRLGWRRYLRLKRKEYDDHHDRIQTKKVRKRMKENAKKSKRVNKNKKPPLWKRLFGKKKR